MYQFSPLIQSMMGGLSITRWNTFPRVREITTLDHLAFLAHTSVILALSLSDSYNIGFILRKILFSGFFTFSYSDINSDVKYRLRRQYPELFHALEQGVLHSVCANNIPERMRSDINLSSVPSREDTLIYYAKMWCSYYEVYHHSRVFPDAYGKLLNNIEHRARDCSNYSLYAQILHMDPNDQTNSEKFLLVIERLSSIYRWNKSERMTPVSVLSHTYLITFFTYCIGILEHATDKEITDMLLTALYHDIPEAITGDIITPTKKAIPGLEKALECIEHEMVHEYLLSYISQQSWYDLVRKKILTPWKESFGGLVKMGDTLSAYHEAKIEIPYSEYFTPVTEKMRENLLQGKKHYIEGLL